MQKHNLDSSSIEYLPIAQMSNFVTDQVPKSIQYNSEDILVYIRTVAQIKQCEGKWLVELCQTLFRFQNYRFIDPLLKELCIIIQNMTSRQHIDVNDGMIISITNNTQSTEPKDNLNYFIQLQMQVITFLVWTAKYHIQKTKQINNMQLE